MKVKSYGMPIRRKRTKQSKVMYVVLLLYSQGSSVLQLQFVSKSGGTLSGY